MRAETPRPLGVWTAVFLGVNAIVGSGIYLFPSILSERVGPLSVAVFACTAIVLAPVAIAYAELGRDHDRSGGTYRYATAGFGDHVGARLGWVSWVTAVVSWAAVANAVPSHLGEFVPVLGRGVGAHVASGGLVVLLTALNWRGVRPGAWVSNGFTIGKLVPLFLLAAAGITVPFLRPEALSPVAPHGVAPAGGAIFLALFAYQGFEVVGVPAGEIRDARRNVPRGVLYSVALAAVLYCLVQLAYVASGSPGGDAPLASAARTFYGSWGGTLLGIGGLVSMIGFNAGTAVGSPRYLFALAEDGHMPAAVARLHPRHGSPSVAILLTGGATLLFALFLDFEALVGLANVSILVQYLVTAAALVHIRRRPAWIVVGLLACVLCGYLGFQAELAQLAGFGAAVLLGEIVLPLARRRTP